MIEQEEFESFEPFEEIELAFDASKSIEVKPRLDRYLSESLLELSRAQIQKLIDAELIVVDGAPAKAATRLRGNELITVRIPPPEPLDLKPEKIDLDVVFEDQFLIVINKAPGMVTHPGAGVTSGTLVNALLHHCQGSLSGISGVERPGIVHRLDKDTSGLLVVAKEDFTHKDLAKQLSERKVKRVYNTLVEGIVNDEAGTIDRPIGRHPVRRKEMAIVETGRRAVTHFQVLQRYRNFTLLEVRLETGRTHQIRVHMSDLGFPVLGDLVYNRKSTGSEKARAKLGLPGQALHAARLSFTHPRTGEAVDFSAPLPQGFAQLVNKLQSEVK